MGSLWNLQGNWPLKEVSTCYAKCGEKAQGCQVWWHTPVIPALGRLRQEGGEFEVSLGCILRPASKKKN
jgi:hypothetical protein